MDMRDWTAFERQEPWVNWEGLTFETWQARSSDGYVAELFEADWQSPYEAEDEVTWMVDISKDGERWTRQLGGGEDPRIPTDDFYEAVLPWAVDQLADFDGRGDSGWGW